MWLHIKKLCGERLSQGTVNTEVSKHGDTTDRPDPEAGFIAARYQTVFAY